jgi:hypothetical protein
VMETPPKNPSDDAQKKRFLWGVLLAWIPFFFFILPAFFNAFREISTQKATGLGAVAGGVICCSGLMLAILGLCLWGFFRLRSY